MAGGGRKEYMKLLAVFSTMGIEMAASVFIGFGMGWLIDQKIFAGRTRPWFMMIFLVFGIIAGFRGLYRVSRRKDL